MCFKKKKKYIVLQLVLYFKEKKTQDFETLCYLVENHAPKAAAKVKFRTCGMRDICFGLDYQACRP